MQEALTKQPFPRFTVLRAGRSATESTRKEWTAESELLAFHKRGVGNGDRGQVFHRWEIGERKKERTIDRERGEIDELLPREAEFRVLAACS